MAIATAAALTGLALATPPAPAAASSAPAQALDRLAKVGQAARALPGDRRQGALAPQKVLRLGVALRPRDPAALTAYAAAVSTPGSAAFHRYLRPAGVAARFGPAPASVAAVERLLRRDGLKVGRPSANRFVVPVSGTVAKVEAAFHTHLERFTTKVDAVGWAASAAPRLPAALAERVTGVLGLNNLSTPRSLLEQAPAGAREGSSAKPAKPRPRPASVGMTHARTDSPVACAAAHNAAVSGGGWTDRQVASAYGLTGLYRAGDLGAGQTIALYELEPYSVSDMIAFDRCYFGASHARQITPVPLDGFAAHGTGTGEALLDVEDVSAIAPDARILVYEGPNTTFGGIDAFNRIISQDRASIVSTSWGECEVALQIGAPEAQQLENTLFEEAAAQGQTVFAASGDTGSDDCASTPFNATSPAAPYLSVDDPASQPYVVGVGGTSLASAKNPPTQTVWNDGARWGGSGGGISTTWPSPPWQADSGVPGVRQGAGRQVPDVSSTADEWRGITVYSQSFAGPVPKPPPGTPTPPVPAGWTTIGGTSSATPTWAAIAADIAASRACASLPAAAGSTHDLGFIGPELYQVAGNPAAYAASFSDVRRGNNDVFGLGRGYRAGPGFDLATGLGSPTVTDAAGHGGLDASLCAVASTTPAAKAPRPAVTHLSPSSGPAAGGTTVTITGSGFPAGHPGDVAVAFGTAKATVVSVPTSTSLVVTSPGAALTADATSFADAGPVQVLVTVAGATSRPGASSVFDEVATSPATTAGSPAAPTVNGIGPSGAEVAGGKRVTVYGNGFSTADPPRVTFGGVRARGVKVLSPAELTAVVPPESPATACKTGRGFDPKAACQVEVVVSDAAGSSPTAPILPSVTGPIVFDAKGVVEPTPETEVAPAATEFDYAPKPVITSVRPDPGDATGSSPVVITGSGFNFNTLEWINFGPPSAVRSEQVDVSTLTPNEIVIVPPGTARRGSSLPLIGGVSVQTAGGLSNVYPFSYAGVPSVRKLDSLGGPSTGGSRLRIVGRNLTAATVVAFVSEVSPQAYGASATIDESSRTPDSITVRTPADLPGPVDVLPCTATACASPDPARDTFVYFSSAGPQLAAVRPRSGPAQGGTPVTLFGDNLNGAVSVRFGSHPSAALAPALGYPDGDPYILGVRAAAGQAGSTVPVTVVTPSGRSRPAHAGTFHYHRSPPSAPRALQVHLAGSRATLSWSPPASSGGRPITGYTVLALAAGVAPRAATLPASARSFTLGHLAAGHSYELRVAARSALGRGLWAHAGPRVVAYAANGYRVATAAGAVSGFGSLVSLGGVGGRAHPSVTAIAPTADGAGYWLLERNGTVTAFGDATPLGFPRSGVPVVAMATDPSGGPGYWLVDARGHVLAYGTARNYGSLRSGSSPAVGIAASPGGRGYWVLSANGSVTAFGAAPRFRGARSSRRGGGVAIAADPKHPGYWVLSAGGTVRGFGAALSFARSGGVRSPGRAVALAPAPDGLGYWVTTASGAVVAYGRARFEGRPSLPAGATVAGIAAG